MRVCQSLYQRKGSGDSILIECSGQDYTRPAEELYDLTDDRPAD